MATSSMFSIYSGLDEECELAIHFPEGYQPSCAVKLRVLGESHILLDAAGILLHGAFRATEKAIDFIYLERGVADFDTEGNWIFCVKSADGTVHRSKNGSLDQWTHLFPDRKGFVQVCCNNNGILLLAGDGRLFVQGDFGSVFNCDQLTEVHDVKKDCVRQLAAGIDFAIVSLQKRTKVVNIIKKDALFQQCVFDEKKSSVYCEWQSIFEQFGLHAEARDYNDVARALEELPIYGHMLHQTGVASFGKVNKGQLGTGDHIRRDKIYQMDICNVAKIASCCDYSSALAVDGQLFLWGDMNKNQAIRWKLGNEGNTSTPSASSRFKHVLDVCSGNFHTYVLTNDLRLHNIKSSSDEESLSYRIASNKLKRGHDIEEDIPFILASDSLLVMNHLPVHQEVLKIYTKEQATMQALLKHIKGINLKHLNGNNEMPRAMANDSAATLSLLHFYRSCTSLFYVLLLRLKSLRLFLLRHDTSRLLSVVLHEEIYLLYKRILQSFCDNECLGLLGSSDQEVLKIYLENVSNQIDLAELLIKSGSRTAEEPLDELTEAALLSMKSEWLRFLNEEVSEKMGSQTKLTKEFWMREENVRWLSLKEPHRRVILDSNEVPLKLLDVHIFSSSPRFVLFNDVFCYVSGMQVVQYPLKLVWITAEVNELQRSRYKEKHRFMMTIITPEETLRCHTLNVADKIRWMGVLKTQVLQCLDRQLSDKQPLNRYARYKFSDRYERYARMEYEGMWLVGQLDGIGALTSSDRSYTGELYQGNITGYGCMKRTVFGISTIYEGEFLNGKYDGYGRLKTTSNRSTQYFHYQGYFRADKYNGFGTLSTSSYQYNGDFVNDQKEGFGVIEDSLNGVKYIGMFMGDKKHGNGILVTTNGTYYAGFFANDILTHSAGGLAIFPSGIYYKGELTTDGPFGKGVFFYPEREIDSEQFELDDSSTKMAGHTMTGIFGGTWNSIKISSATMAMEQTFNKVPMLDLKINAERKWSSIFACFHETLFGTSDIVAIRRMDIKKVWNRVAIFVCRAKRKEQLKANDFQASSGQLDDRSSTFMYDSGYQLQNGSTTSLRASISDSRLSLLNSPLSPAVAGVAAEAADAISVSSVSSVTSREEDEFMLKMLNDNGRITIARRCYPPVRDLDFVPDFCIKTVDREGLHQLRGYLADAFQSVYHPLYGLFEKLSNCFYSTYSCWKYTPNSILCEPAMNEWISIVSRIYTLVLTVMFPALPKDSVMIDGELLSYQSLLYPVLMTQGIYSALFVLYASKCSKNDEIYRQRILICMKKTDENLVQLLDINRDLVPIIKHEKYQQAIESLNRFREKCCPSEMIKHINDAFALVDQSCKEQEVRMDVAADNLLELIIWLIIKANLPQLGAEISLLEDLMQNDYGISYRNTQNDYCLITLKASYQHIISENFFVNKTFETNTEA